MKKILIIIPLLLIVGCTKNTEKPKYDIKEDEQIEIEEPKYVDDNPIKIGIYKDNKLITNYQTQFIHGSDLGVFDIFFTNLEIVDNNSTKVNYKKYYNEYENIENYKTGFYITFEANGKKYEETILDSTKKHAMAPYLYMYLYDDVNQPDGAWYSHIEPENENENTIFSSIKLFYPYNDDGISSNITLTVFTYKDENDFDENNHYRGNSSYTITIESI